jgi:hypothetical protein
MIKKERKTKYTVKNVNFFNPVNSYNSAYILGFIAADGCIVDSSKGNPYLSIGIHEKDIEVLNFINSCLGSSNLVYKIPNKPYVRLNITNQHIVQSLISLGIVFRKTFKLKDILANIDQKYRPAFIVGYFDGDGSAVRLNTSRKRKLKNGTISEHPNHRIFIKICSGSLDLLNSIVKELNLVSYSIQPNKSIHVLVIRKATEVIKFFNCYLNLSFYLSRKHSKIIDYFNEPTTKKILQDQTISSS